ncbi:hypothetical protein SAMN05444364_10937 [Prevotella scopos JCM 17725]|uniref:Uncharacterized protein n=1 Tax=Prevotella scopos JCM 17725 TaxID=1236518 RepID=A0AAX2F2Z3_9BACT|nr:hypothetical protein SAMN05444364_10937 [Prevotella scopos JCM 17725]
MLKKMSFHVFNYKKEAFYFSVCHFLKNLTQETNLITLNF